MNWFVGRWLSIMCLLGLCGFASAYSQAPAWPIQNVQVAFIHQAVETQLQNAEYRAADSLLRRTLASPALPESDRCLLLLTWSRELTLSAQFAKALAVLQFAREHCAKIIAQNQAAKAHLVECLADIATEVQLTPLRSKAASQLEKAYTWLPAGSPRRTILARKIAVLHRMSKNQAAHAWLATAWQEMNGECIDRMRLLTEEALQANKDADFEANGALLASAVQLSQQCARCTAEDIIQQQVAYAEYYNEASHKASDPIALMQQEEQALLAMEAAAAAHPEIISSHLAHGLRLHADIALEFGDFEQAEALARRALDAQLRRGIAPKMVSACYSSLGQQCHYLGRLDEALQYYSLSLLNYPQKEEPLKYISKVANYGQELIQNERFAEGELYMEEAVSLMMAYGLTDHGQLGIFFLNLAVGYDHQNCKDDALEYYGKAAQFLQEVGSTACESQARIGAATMHLQLGDTVQSKAEADLGKAAIARLSNLVPMDKVSPLLDLATYYQLLGDLDAALRANLALQKVIVPNDTTRSPYACPDLKNSINLWDALGAVDQKMGILWELYAQRGDPMLLRSIVRCGEEALVQLRRLRQTRNNEDGKLKVNQKWHKLHENTLRAAMELYHQTQDPVHLKTAFEIAEQSRAMMLMEAIVENRVLEKNEATAQMATQKRNLESRMNMLRRQLWSAASDARAMQQLQAELLRLQDELDALLVHIHAANPKYYGTVYEFDVVQMPALQAHLLAENRSLIEFFYGEDVIYTFVVTPDTFAVYENVVTKTLEANLHAFTQSLHVIPNEVSPESAKAYALQSKAITEVLWQPIAKLLGKQITIIPDGPLSFISFDALVLPGPIQNEVKFQDLTYLLERHTISYAYSATLQCAPEPARARPQKGILAIAPSFEGNAKIPPLTQSQAGVLGIADDFEGVDALTYLEATKPAFLRAAPNYQILELATHGAYDRKNFLDSRIYFAADGSGDSLLYLRELYTLSLPADLAILEACETGLGDYHRGEGMMSLARGFTYAGCRSVLMSLWEVSEGDATRAIIHGFYDHLAEGMARDEAIATAKRDYLQSVRNEGGSAYWFMHPFYWSELVLIGEQGPLLIARTQTNYFAALGLPSLILLLVLLGFLYRRHRSKRVNRQA